MYTLLFIGLLNYFPISMPAHRIDGILSACLGRLDSGSMAADPSV